MLDSRDIGGLQGAPVIGQNNDKLGTVGQVFLDSETGAPNWVTIKTGLFGHKETFIPLANARWDGEEIHVDIDRETVKEAPRIDTDEALSPHNEEALYRYYGLSDRDTDGGTARPDAYPDREYALGPDGQTVTPVPTGTTDADQLRDRDALRDRDRLRDSDHDGRPDAAERAGTRDTDADRHDDAAAFAARSTDQHRDDTRRTDQNRAASDENPRNLADFHPEANRGYGKDPHDLRMSEQPLEDPPSSGSNAGGTGKHSRMRRYDPAADGAEGRPADRDNPPRTL